MSALEKNAGDASGMNRHAARHALVDLGLVHATLEMKEKFRLGAHIPATDYREK